MTGDLAVQPSSLPDAVSRLLHSPKHACAITSSGLCAAFSEATLLIWRFQDGASASTVTQKLPYASKAAVHLHVVSTEGEKVNPSSDACMV